MSNTVKVIAAGLIAAGLLAGCINTTAGTATQSGDTGSDTGTSGAGGTSGGGGQSASPSTVTLGAVTLPAQVDGYIIRPCAAAADQAAGGSTREASSSDSVFWFETGLEPNFHQDDEGRCDHSTDTLSRVIDSGWGTLSDGELSLVDMSGWPETFGDVHCQPNPTGRHCSRLIGHVQLSAQAAVPGEMYSYKEGQWHQPTTRELADVIDATATALGL